MKLDVKDEESKLRQTKINLKQSFVTGQGKIKQAELEAEKDYNLLKEDVVRAEHSLEREKSYLEMAKIEKERGFDVN